MTLGHNRLPELAEQIHNQHTAVLGSLKTAIEHAMTAGDLLLEAKDKIPHGGWLSWLKGNCPGLPERTARHYMQLARGRETLKSANLADLTVSDALELLSAPDPGGVLKRFLACVSEIDPRIEVSPVGMKFPEDLSFEAWLAVGELIQCYFPTEVARA